MWFSFTKIKRFLFQHKIEFEISISISVFDITKWPEKKRDVTYHNSSVNLIISKFHENNNQIQVEFGSTSRSLKKIWCNFFTNVTLQNSLHSWKIRKSQVFNYIHDIYSRKLWILTYTYATLSAITLPYNHNFSYFFKIIWYCTICTRYIKISRNNETRYTNDA